MATPSSAPRVGEHAPDVVAKVFVWICLLARLRETGVKVRAGLEGRAATGSGERARTNQTQPPLGQDSNTSTAPLHLAQSLRPTRKPPPLLGCHFTSLHRIIRSPSLPLASGLSGSLSHPLYITPHTLSPGSPMATSQPIALPASTSAAPDVLMASGSFLGANTFNPASYTRHFLGSPLSWRAGSSFGGRFFPGCSPMGPIESVFPHHRPPFRPSILSSRLAPVIVIHLASKRPTLL